MTIEVSVPSMLKSCTGGQSLFTLEAATLDEAVRKLTETYPLLRLHLYDEQGRQRPHVLLYYNEENIQWLDTLDIPLKKGDRLTVLQAVSGGAITRAGRSKPWHKVAGKGPTSPTRFSTSGGRRSPTGSVTPTASFASSNLRSSEVSSPGREGTLPS